MVHLHGMKTRDRNKHVVHELLKKTTANVSGSGRDVEVVKSTPSPSDSVRKRQASDLKTTSIFGREVVGRKVAIFWRKPGQWFKGKIHSYIDKTQKHFVKYEDGDQAEVNLTRERFQFLTNPRAGAAPNPTYQGSPKGKEAVGHKVRVYWPAMSRWYVGRVKEYNKATGKHLIAYQDGEQHLVLLRNEAVRFPHVEAGKKALKMDAQKKASGRAGGAQKAPLKVPSPAGEKIRRTSHRGKRVAADCNLNSNQQQQLSGDSSGQVAKKAKVARSESANCHSGNDEAHKPAALKKLRSARSVLDRRQEESSVQLHEASSMEEGTSHSKEENHEGMTSTYMEKCQMDVSTANSEDSMRNIQCPTTPDNDNCCIMERHKVYQEPSKSEDHGTSCEAEPESRERDADGVATESVQTKDAMQMKAELAKVKAIRAKEIAARKAEEAAKALAAVAAAQKAEAREPQGKDAVGWRLGVWSPEEHKYFKGQVIGFEAGSGEHKIQFDGGRVDAIFLDQQRTKWLNKTATKPVGVAPPKGNQGGKPAQGRCADPKLLKNIVGRHIKVHRGQEKLIGKVIAFSPSRQKYLILLQDSRHEWSDFKRNNWELLDTTPAKPSHLPSGMEAVNWRVGIYWPKREKFFQGQITNFEASSGQYLVRYDDGEESWVDLNKEEVKWFTRSFKSQKSFSSPKSFKLAAKKSQNEVVLDDDAIEIMTCHPELFAHSTANLPGEKLDVLSNIHNSNGLMIPLEELSARQKSHKAASNALPVHSVDDVWGVKVISSNFGETSDKYAENRLTLSNRLQSLEFMLEVAEQSLLKKEDIQPLEPVDSVNKNFDNLEIFF